MKNVRKVFLTHDEHAAVLALVETTRNTMNRVMTGPDSNRFSREELDAMVTKYLTLHSATVALKDAR